MRTKQIKIKNYLDYNIIIVENENQFQDEIIEFYINKENYGYTNFIIALNKNEFKKFFEIIEITDGILEKFIDDNVEKWIKEYRINLKKLES